MWLVVALTAIFTVSLLSPWEGVICLPLVNSAIEDLSRERAESATDSSSKQYSESSKDSYLQTTMLTVPAQSYTFDRIDEEHTVRVVYRHVRDYCEPQAFSEWLFNVMHGLLKPIETHSSKRLPQDMSDVNGTVRVIIHRLAYRCAAHVINRFGQTMKRFKISRDPYLVQLSFIHVGDRHEDSPALVAPMGGAVSVGVGNDHAAAVDSELTTTLSANWTVNLGLTNVAALINGYFVPCVLANQTITNSTTTAEDASPTRVRPQTNMITTIACWMID